MAEASRDRDPNSAKNPPQAVVNPRVRRAAVWTFLPPLVIFFAGIAILLFYWRGAPPPEEREAATLPRAEGTSGQTEPREQTPGGHNPDRVPSSTRAEIDQRAGQALDELGAVFAEDGRTSVGRRVALQELDVERVDSPTLFWVRDGNARVAVVIPQGHAPVRAGQKVNIAGTVERAGDSLQIRASRVEVTGS
jgi:hypothetical protein